MPLYDTYNLIHPSSNVDLNALREDIVHQKLQIADMNNPVNVKYMDDKYANSEILNLMDDEIDKFTGERFIHYDKYLNPTKDIRVKDISKFSLTDENTGKGYIEFFLQMMMGMFVMHLCYMVNLQEEEIIIF